MKKIKWLCVSLPLPASSISSLLLRHQYTETEGKGFLLSATGDDILSGKFIEKIIKKSVVIDPFGNHSESIVTSYYIANFKITKSSRLLELTSPPRSLRRFVHQLHELLGLGLELSEVRVDPLLWLSSIEKKIDSLSVQQISSSGITVSESGLAKVSVSGKKDIRQEFESMVGDKFRIIDSLKFVAVVDDCHIAVELTKQGSVKITGHIYDGLLDALKDCLEAVI